MFTRVSLFCIVFIFVLTLNSYAQYANIWAENNFTSQNGSKGVMKIDGTERTTRWDFQKYGDLT